MDFSTVAAAMGGWPSSTDGEDKVGGGQKNSIGPSSDLGDLYLRVQKHTHNHQVAPVPTDNVSAEVEERSSGRIEIARVVSNDDEDGDEIPDLTITQTKSFDEDENIVNGTDARSLQVICEQDEEGIEGREGNQSTTSTFSVGVTVSPMVEEANSPLIAQSKPQASNIHSDHIRSMLYDEVRKATERCAEMQKILDDKDTEFKEVRKIEMKRTSPKVSELFSVCIFYVSHTQFLCFTLSYRYCQSLMSRSSWLSNATERRGTIIGT